MAQAKTPSHPNASMWRGFCVPIKQEYLTEECGTDLDLYPGWCKWTNGAWKTLIVQTFVMSQEGIQAYFLSHWGKMAYGECAHFETSIGETSGGGGLSPHPWNGSFLLPNNKSDPTYDQNSYVYPSNAEATFVNAQGSIDFRKASKPCHVGIHWEALAENYPMSTRMPEFQSFFWIFALFCIGEISHQQHTGGDSKKWLIVWQFAFFFNKVFGL